MVQDKSVRGHTAATAARQQNSGTRRFGCLLEAEHGLVMVEVDGLQHPAVEPSLHARAFVFVPVSAVVCREREQRGAEVVK